MYEYTICINKKGKLMASLEVYHEDKLTYKDIGDMLKTIYDYYRKYRPEAFRMGTFRYYVVQELHERFNFTVPKSKEFYEFEHEDYY